MGANVWQRDAAGSGQGTSFKTGSAAGPHPARLGKRKLVWTKDQHDQPATPAASAPQPVAHRGDLPASNSSRQHDHFEKRARLNESFSAPHNGFHRGHAAPPPRRHEDRGPLLADTRQQQTGAASQDSAAVLERRKREAELAELKRRIQQHEVQAAEHKRKKAALEAHAAQEEKHEQGKRRAKLEAGFAEAFKHAKQMADAEAAQRKTPVKLASADEIRRVLNAKTDYDCLQVNLQADALTIKRKYKELAVALHPDKCKAAGATDAFQRLVKAYQNLLKHAKKT
ncbi:hypothetical protein ABBQ38_008095 [Trebouxia sp. C0009 RCD-2024]